MKLDSEQKNLIANKIILSLMDSVVPGDYEGDVNDLHSRCAKAVIDEIERDKDESAQDMSECKINNDSLTVNNMTGQFTSVSGKATANVTQNVVYTNKED